MSDAELNDLLGALNTPTANASASASTPKPFRSAVVQPHSAPRSVAKTALPRLSQQGEKGLDDVDAILANISFDANSKEAAAICTKCRHAIPKEVAYREVQGKPYHQDCWKCSTCQKNLGDEEFYVTRPEAHNCEKCHNSTLTSCSACRQPIAGGAQVANVDGIKYHATCFVCSVCRKPLDRFTESGGKFYCEKDYKEAHNPKCTSCQKALTTQYAQVPSGSYHLECFTCSKCRGVIGANKYYPEGNQVLCTSCKK